MIPKKDLKKILNQLLTAKIFLFLTKKANKKSKGNEKANLPKTVIKKSTSLVKLFIIIWVVRAKTMATNPSIDPNKLLLMNHLKIKNIKFKL